MTNKNPNDNVAILSIDEYDSLTETLAVQLNKYLMDKIHRGQKQVKEGKTQRHELINPDQN